jgi:hypothetical protein
VAQRAEPVSQTHDRTDRHRRLRPAERARLAREIVASYLLVRRTLPRQPIAVALTTLRGDQASALIAPAPVAPVDGPELIASRRLGRAVTRLLAWLPGDTRCLVRSLVLVRLLARRGVPAKLIIGTRSKPEFLAHAWVEVAGQPVTSPGDGSFGRLVEL